MPHLQKAMIKTFFLPCISFLVSNFNSEKEISPKSWLNKQTNQSHLDISFLSLLQQREEIPCELHSAHYG